MTRMWCLHIVHMGKTQNLNLGPNAMAKRKPERSLCKTYHIKPQND